MSFQPPLTSSVLMKSESHQSRLHSQVEQVVECGERRLQLGVALIGSPCSYLLLPQLPLLLLPSTLSVQNRLISAEIDAADLSIDARVAVTVLFLATLDDHGRPLLFAPLANSICIVPGAWLQRNWHAGLKRSGTPNRRRKASSSNSVAVLV
jgi:hypothetical protein